MKKNLIIGFALSLSLLSSWAGGLDECSRSAAHIAIAKEIDAAAENELERLLCENSNVLGDWDKVTEMLFHWETRLEWSKHAVPRLIPLFRALRSSGRLSYCVVQFGEATIVFLPWPEGKGKLVVIPSVRTCAPFDPIAQFPPTAIQCDPFCLWRGKQECYILDVALSKEEKGEYLCRLSMHPKYKVVYVFIDSEQDVGKEGFWSEPQAAELLDDYDWSLGKPVSSGKFVPDFTFMRLLESDFPALARGEYTKDFMLGMPEQSPKVASMSPKAEEPAAAIP